MAPRSTRTRWRSIGHALSGLARLIREEANARVHLCATALVVAIGAAARLSAEEWRSVLFACATVWSAEGFNSAIERVCDRVCPTHDPLIGAAKDIAAAAVLIAAAGAVLIGATIFLPRIASACR